MTRETWSELGWALQIVWFREAVEKVIFEGGTKLLKGAGNRRPLSRGTLSCVWEAEKRPGAGAPGEGCGPKRSWRSAGFFCTAPWKAGRSALCFFFPQHLCPRAMVAVGFCQRFGKCQWSLTWPEKELTMEIWCYCSGKFFTHPHLAFLPGSPFSTVPGHPPCYWFTSFPSLIFHQTESYKHSCSGSTSYV